MKRPNQITTDLGDALHSRLESLVETTGKSKSDLVKLAVLNLCNADIGDISKSVKDLSKLISEKKRSAKKPRQLTEEDHLLISTWRRVFSVSDKTRIFAPAILNVIWNARKAGLSQEELVDLVEVAPQNRWVREQMAVNSPPPLSAILSEKMIPHLLMLVPTDDEDEVENLDEYKRDSLDHYWEQVKLELRDEFRDRVVDARTHKDIDLICSSYVYRVTDVKP